MMEVFFGWEMMGWGLPHSCIYIDPGVRVVSVVRCEKDYSHGV